MGTAASVTAVPAIAAVDRMVGARTWPIRNNFAPSWNLTADVEFARKEVLPMTEPTEKEVVAKAKSLAHEDGLLWDQNDPRVNQIGVGGRLDESLRANYLNRARVELRRETRMSDDGF